MDMVNSPTKEEKRPSFSLGVSRHGTTLQPSGMSRPAAVDNFLRSTANQSTASDETEAVVEAEPSKDKPDEVSEVTQSPRDIESTTEPKPDLTSSGSPFLPDAKVEKRPLGRPAALAGATQFFRGPSSAPRSAPAPVSASAEVARLDVALESKDAQLPEQPLPAELDSELLDIETRAEGPPQSDQHTPAAKSTPATATASSNTSNPVPSAAASSIPQQYKVQSNAGGQPTGTIYDTADYHQPLAHVSKNKPGWLLVVGIIVILLLGAAGGAAAYFFGLI
jgi:hypothetical protein